MMKKLLLLLVVLMIGTSGFGQDLKRGKLAGVPSGPTEGHVAFTKTSGGNANTDVLQNWVLPFDGGYSGNTRAPGNTFRYQRTMYLISPAEMAASGFPTGQLIDGIGFEVYIAGGTSQTGSFKVYMMNTSDATYQLGNQWNTSGFTLVSDKAAFTVPVALGPYIVNFSGGSPFTYTGGGVYVAWEFSNPSPGTLGTTALNIACNYQGLAGSLYGQRSNTAMPTTLLVSSFRPATMFVNNALTDIFAVTNIYATEKCPVPFGLPTKISVRVQNVDISESTFDLTLSINSNPPYTATLSGIELGGGTTGIYDFTGWTPTNLENVTITATVSPGDGENWLSNNTMAIPAQVNNNLFSYSYGGVPSSSLGLTYPGSGIFGTLYHMNGPGLVTGAKFYTSSDAEPNSSIGEEVYAVVLNSAGTIVATSAPLELTSGNVNMINTFTFDTPPLFTDEDFYIGLVQPSGTGQYYPMGYSGETPGRTGTFVYWSGTTGGGAPTDLNGPALGFDLKFIAEAMVAPVPAPIPTLTEWGLILLGLALLGFGTFYILRMRA